MEDSLRDCKLVKTCTHLTACIVDHYLQLEEGIGDLQHQNMRMVVLVADQNGLASPPHTMLVIVLLQPAQTIFHRWILLWLRLFCAECVVA